MSVKMEVEFNKEHKSLPNVSVFFSGTFYMPEHMDALIKSLIEARTWLAKKATK